MCPDVAAAPVLAATQGETFTAASTIVATDGRSDIRVQKLHKTHSSTSEYSIRIQLPIFVKIYRIYLWNTSGKRDCSITKGLSMLTLEISPRLFSPWLVVYLQSVRHFSSAYVACWHSSTGKPHRQVMAYLACRLFFIASLPPLLHH